jgi:hypothetical protein
MRVGPWPENSGLGKLEILADRAIAMMAIANLDGTTAADLILS